MKKFLWIIPGIVLVLSSCNTGDNYSDRDNDGSVNQKGKNSSKQDPYEDEDQEDENR